MLRAFIQISYCQHEKGRDGTKRDDLDLGLRCLLGCENVMEDNRIREDEAWQWHAVKHPASHERRRRLVFIFIARVYPGGKGGAYRVWGIYMKAGEGEVGYCNTYWIWKTCVLGATEGTKA